MSVYSTGGPVVTGRNPVNGDYCNGTLTAKANNRELACGWMLFTGVKSFSIIPILTWADYPTGIVDIPLDASGNPTSSAPAAVYNSYIGDSGTPWHWTHNNLHTDALHGLELRYYCSLYYNMNIANGPRRWIVWMSSGSGWDFYQQPGQTPPQGLAQTKYPKINFDLSASFEMTVDVACHERVTIDQQVDGEGKWIWPTGCFKDGMGTTQATFDAIGNKVISSITINGSSISMPSDFALSSNYDFSSARTIEGKVGLYTNAIGSFGWGSFMPYVPTPYFWTNQTVFSSLTQIGQMTIGVKEMDLRLRAGQTYTGTDTGYAGLCEGDALDNTFSYKAKNSPASASGNFVGTYAKWTNLGLNYKHLVDFAMMDGAAQDDISNTAPSFTDSGNHSWTGSDSGLISYDGTWELKMYDLGGAIMDTANTATDSAGSGAQWGRSNPAPSYISLKLNNPEAYNDTAVSIYDPDTETTTTYDDHRVQFVYPREVEEVSQSMASTIIVDALDTVGSSGVSGWTAHNCTLAAVGGDLVVTGASAGAYIYRADFMTSADIRKPKHWPAHRFAHIEATCMNAVPAAIPFALSLTVKRTGGADTMEKVFSHFVTTATGGLFDTCKPDGSGGADTCESYIDLAQPLDTAWISSARQSNELSTALSWSWGIGTFDRVEIGGFTAGNTYTLKGLTTQYKSETWGDYSLVQPECNAKRSTGATVLNGNEEDNINLWLWRHCIGVVNGKYGFEVPSTKLSITGSGVESYENLTVKSAFASGSDYLFPKDDYGAFTWTIPADNVAGDWSGTEWVLERHIFAGDLCPVWFLLEKPQGTEQDNAHSTTIMASPRYDRITVYPSWGDGTGTTARTGWVTLKSIKRVRGRANGIYWDDFAYGVDTVDVESAYAETLTTDELGYFRSGDHNKPTTISKDAFHFTIDPKNRVWSRVCFSLPTGAIFLNACSSRQTGRCYIVYSLGASLKVRIFDYGNAAYQDRDIKAYTTDHACGIAYTAGRKAGLAVVYDKDGSIYRTESFSEGKDWTTAVSIATGTYPQTCYDQTTRIEYTTYYDGGNAHVIMKKGEGNYGSPVTIASSDEAPCAIEVLPGTREHKIVAAVVQSGVIVRYVSTNDGKTWVAT